MENFASVRSLARHWHTKASDSVGGLKPASALLEGAMAIAQIERQAVPDDDPVLCGAEAILEPSIPAIFYKKGVPSELAVFYQAHELGHYWLDNATGACNASEIDDLMSEERTPLGIQRVEGYGPRERRECQANVFAREFLLPCSEAKRLFVEQRFSAMEIAEHLGLSRGLVNQQLSRALLTPESQAPEIVDQETPSIDCFQKAAAEAKNNPHLIEAGPGTGKTHTLIARINWLLTRGINPSSILVLTFSNKAAEEIRERVSFAAPQAASAIWAGTFHAFGLEILRKYGHLTGLQPNVHPVDPSGALLLLEEALPSLPIKHYLQLHEPTLALQGILNAISRAKDELIKPAEYRAFGEAMLAEAMDDDSRETAEKVIEVADVFAMYEDILQTGGTVDFSDLIAKPVKLLEDHPKVKSALRAQYQQVLVDEYQDVNRASGVLLKLLAGDGKTLWVVGDARQSIYRFRGASPLNLRKFEEDFPQARKLSLGINYRSQKPVVQLVEAFAPMMKVSIDQPPPRWNAKRENQGGEIQMKVATNLEAEVAGLAQEIKRRHDQGVPYKEQAILCRTHTNLARFASGLEAHGVPVLYFGDLFERPEIRDMLALLSFICEQERGGLLRLAQFPEYNIPMDDVRKILAFAHTHSIGPLEAIRQLGNVPEITPSGFRGLELLSTHLNDLHQNITPATLLLEYLFTRSRYLDTLLADEDAAGQQQRLALFQFLQIIIERKPSGNSNPQKELLQWIRRLEILGYERQLRQPPSVASEIDAVRVLTVHASKGLEFNVVYLPGLGTTMFPANPQPNLCPLPTAMLMEAPKDSHTEEEECLFFVAMSRARDILCFSRAEKYSVNRKVSPLLTKLTPHLPNPPDTPAHWRDTTPIEKTEKTLRPHTPTLDIHTAEDLDQYIRCPLTYLYQRILGLSGERDDNAYVRFHRAVYAVLHWMDHSMAETSITFEQARKHLETAWAEIGPADHPYSSVYWNRALLIIKNMVSHHGDEAKLTDTDWILNLSEGQVQLRPDYIKIDSDGVIVRRLRTGRSA